MTLGMPRELQIEGLPCLYDGHGLQIMTRERELFWKINKKTGSFLVFSENKTVRNQEYGCTAEPTCVNIESSNKRVL